MHHRSPLYWPSLALFALFVFLASRALVAGNVPDAVIYMASTFLATIILAANT